MSNEKEIFIKTENISEKLKAEKLREKIEAQREKRRLLEKFQRLPNLVDDAEEEDAAEWYQRTKNSQNTEPPSNKKVRRSEPKNDDPKQSSKKYTANHLKGLAVGHKLDSIKEGQQIVLTLRDKDVLGEDEDVLENVNLIDEEKAAKNIENKSKRPEYRPYDDDEFDEFGIIKKPSLLNKYDEEIEGPQQDLFRIGTSSNIQQNSMKNFKDDLETAAKKVSIDWNDLKIANEYFTQEEMEVKFKKLKKKSGNLRKRNTRKVEIPENNESQDIVVEQPAPKKIKTSEKTQAPAPLQLDINNIDDDNLIGPDEDISGIIIDDEAENELQNALYKARKIKLREKMVDPALNIARIVEEVKRERPEDLDQEDEDMDHDSRSNAPLVLNATAEFCRNLGEFYVAPDKTLKSERMDVEDNEIKPEYNNDDEDQDRYHSDDSNDDGPNNNKYKKNNWNEVDVKAEEEFDETSQQSSSSINNNKLKSQPILEEEPDVSIGVAGALKLAMTKGYLDKETSKSFGATRSSSIIQAQSYTIEEKFYEDDRMGGRRDHHRYSGPIQEFREKSNYKPDFKLDYVDEKGRRMNQKEAFRYLSHKFHGKGPGKNKIDKRMKKMEQESKLRQMSSTDTPLNTVKLLQDKQKELQTPYIVLSGSSSNMAPNISKISKSK